MATWPGNVAWFSDDGESAVAYRVINGIAITMSDPICAPEHDGRVIREFAAFCDANSWVPVFYSVHPQYLPVFDELGWQHMSVGEETLVRTSGLELLPPSREPAEPAVLQPLTFERRLLERR